MKERGSDQTAAARVDKPPVDLAVQHVSVELAHFHVTSSCLHHQHQHCSDQDVSMPIDSSKPNADCSWPHLLCSPHLPVDLTPRAPRPILLHRLHSWIPDHHPGYLSTRHHSLSITFCPRRVLCTKDTRLSKVR